MLTDLRRVYWCPVTCRMAPSGGEVVEMERSCGPTHIPLRVLVVLATPICLWLTCICFKRRVGFFWCNFVTFLPRQATPRLNQQYAVATKRRVPILKMSSPAQRSCQSRGKSAAVINSLLLTNLNWDKGLLDTAPCWKHGDAYLHQKCFIIIL